MEEGKHHNAFKKTDLSQTFCSIFVKYQSSENLIVTCILTKTITSGSLFKSSNPSKYISAGDENGLQNPGEISGSENT